MVEGTPGDFLSLPRLGAILYDESSNRVAYPVLPWAPLGLFETWPSRRGSFAPPTKTESLPPDDTLALGRAYEAFL